MKWLLATMCLVGLLAFSRLQSAPLATAAADSTEAPMSEAPKVDGICPRAWTCNFVNWYGTLASCRASACGATCELDYRCNGSCVCP
jgi:hypothetical protein